MESASYAIRKYQAVHHLAILEVGLHDFIDVAVVDKGVPGTLGINHRNRAACTAIQATGLVHAHLPFASQAFLFDAALAMVKTCLGTMQCTAILAIGTLIQAKKDVALIVATGVVLIVLILGVTHSEAILGRLLAARESGHHIRQRHVRPEPAQPLTQTVKADEAPLLPGLQSLGKVHIGRSLIKYA